MGIGLLEGSRTYDLQNLQRPNQLKVEYVEIEAADLLHPSRPEGMKPVAATGRALLSRLF